MKKFKINSDRRFGVELSLGEKGEISIDDGYDSPDHRDFSAGQYFGNDGNGVSFVIHTDFNLVPPIVDLYMMNSDKQPAKSQKVIDYLVEVIGCQPKSNDEVRYSGPYDLFKGCMTKVYTWEETIEEIVDSPSELNDIN